MPAGDRRGRRLGHRQVRLLRTIVGLNRQTAGSVACSARIRQPGEADGGGCRPLGVLFRAALFSSSPSPGIQVPMKEHTDPPPA
jgi:ABC-type transporter Mla maintaining outer membrane lipid asymmetry ATPase subunit MlaF